MSKVLEAVEADWEWLTPSAHKALSKIAEGAYNRNQDILQSEDDVFQDLCLYLAVRPDYLGDEGLLIYKAKMHVKDLVRQSVINRNREVVFTDLEPDVYED